MSAGSGGGPQQPPPNRDFFSLLGENGAVAAALGTLAVVLTFLGWRSADYPWLINNEATLFAIAVIGVIASVIGVIWFTTRRRLGSNRRRVLDVCFVLLSLGILAGVLAGVRGWNHPEFPYFVSPAFQAGADGTRVTAKLKGARIDSEDRITFFVDTLRWKDETDTYDVTHRRSDVLGPDKDGNLDQSISTLLPPGDYRHVGLIAWVGEKEDFSSAQDCYNQGSEDEQITCVVLMLERSPEQPQLTTDWIRRGAQSLLRVRVVTRYTENRPVFLTVTGLMNKGRRRELASFGLEPDATARFDRTILVTIPRRFSRVCVVALAGTRAAGCPNAPRRNARVDTVWEVVGRNVAQSRTVRGRR